MIADALRRAAAGFVTSARAADPDRPVKATPGWCGADLVSHVAIECDRYRRELEGDSDWSPHGTDIPATNRRALAARSDREVERAAASIVADVERYASLLAERDPDTPSHHLDGGLLLAPRHAAGVLLGELVVHRHDLDAAAPIEREDAVAIVSGALHTMPGMLDADAARGLTATVEFRVRGAGTHTVHVADGRATTTDGPASGRRDAVLSVDPVGFLLLSYGRRGQLATVLRGQVLAWGRRLDKAFAFDRVFTRP